MTLSPGQGNRSPDAQNLVGLSVFVVRRRMVFRTRPFDRTRQLLQYIHSAGMSPN